jgi:PAS domain S-box-containing protein
MPTAEVIALRDELHALVEHGDLLGLGSVELSPGERFPDALLTARILLADVEHWAEREDWEHVGLARWNDLADQLRAFVREVEHQLGAHARHLAAVTRMMPALVWSTDVQLQVTSVVGAEAMKVGQRQVQRVSVPLATLLASVDDASPAFAAHRRALQGESASCDIHWGGSPYHMRVVPFLGRDGAIIGTVGTAMSLSTRPIPEDAAETLVKRFEQALRHTPVIVYSQDADLRLTWIYNPQYGFKPEEVLGKTDAELVHPDDAAVLAVIKRRVLATGVGERHEVRLTVGAEVAHYDVAIEPLRSPRGEIIGITGAATNITARKQTEELLARRETQLKEAQRLARIGSWEWDLKTERLSWSDEHYRIFAFDPDAGVPDIATAQSRIHPDDRARVMELWMHSLETGEPYACDLRLVHPDGAVRVIHSRGTMARDAAGRPERMVGTAQDITERVELEAEQATRRERQARLEGMIFSARQLAARMTDNLERSYEAVQEAPSESSLPPAIGEQLSTVMQDLLALRQLVDSPPANDVTVMESDRDARLPGA